MILQQDREGAADRVNRKRIPVSECPPIPYRDRMSRHRTGVRVQEYEEDDDYLSQSPGSYPGESLSSSVERQYMFNRYCLQLEC